MGFFSRKRRDAPLRFGVVENYTLVGSRKIWKAAEAFMERLSETLGHPVLLKLVHDYEALLQQLVTAQLDMAWMSPVTYIRALEQGARLIAVCRRHDALTYRSAILVPFGKTIEHIDDLRGLRFAWGDPQSAANHLLPKLTLRELGLTTFDFMNERFYGSAISAALAVIDGEADVCTSYVRDAPVTDPALKLDIARSLSSSADKLRIYVVSDPIPCDGLVINGAVEEEMADSIRKAMIALSTTSHANSPIYKLFEADNLAPLDPHIEAILESWSWDMMLQPA